MASARVGVPPPGANLRWSRYIPLAAFAAVAVVTTVAATLTGGTFLLLVAGISALVAALMYPSIVVPLVIAILFTNLAGNAVNLYGAPSAVPLAIPLLLLVPVWFSWFESGRRLVWPPVMWLFLAFIAANLLGVIMARDADAAMAQVVSLMTEGFVLIVLLVNAIRTRDALRLALIALVASAALVGAMSVFQDATETYYTRYLGIAQLSDDAFATGEETLAGEVIQLRLGGPVGEKNYYAQFMLMVIPVGAAMALTARTRPRRLALVVGTMLIGGGLILTFSRGAAVAAVAVLAIGVVLRMLPLRVAVVGILGAAMLVAVYPEFVTRVSTVVEVSDLGGSSASEAPDSALRGRAAENAAAFAAFADQPVFGLGPGQFPSNYERYARKVGVEDLHATDRRAHSLYLAMLAEVGIVGTALFLAVIAAVVAPLLRVWRRSTNTADMAIAVGLLLGLAGYLVAGLFLDLAYARYFWLYIGLAIAGGVILSPRVGIDHDAGDELLDASRPSERR